MHEIFFPRSFLVFTHSFAFFSVPIAGSGATARRART
jgi:hypothetical protein